MRTRLRSKVTLLFMVLGLVLAVPAVALASDLDTAVVDVEVDDNNNPLTSVTVNPGGERQINTDITVTGRQQNSASFKVYQDWTLANGTFTGSNPVTVTVPARAAGDAAFTQRISGTLTVDENQAAGGPFELKSTPFDLATSSPAALAVDTLSPYYVTVEEPPPPSDTTPPDISYVLNPASPDGSNGWYKSDVTLTWIVTENESNASLQTTGCEDQNIIADQAETTYSCSATSDGGSAGPVEVKIKRDATLPNVSLVGGPANNGSYYFGSVPAAPTCQASDDTSGLDGSCAVSGYGTAVGSHTVTAEAKDLAGNTNSASNTYSVLAWTLAGFKSPVDMGIMNDAKGGSTVPLKFEVFAGATELTSTSVVDWFTQKISCAAGPGDLIEQYATGNTELRYDTTSGQFIFNWKTPKAPNTCYRVTLQTDDGSSIYADFRLK